MSFLSVYTALVFAIATWAGQVVLLVHHRPFLQTWHEMDAQRTSAPCVSSEPCRELNEQSPHKHALPRISVGSIRPFSLAVECSLYRHRQWCNG
eukprot:1785721-Prymnesium_polylepis.1